MSTYQDTKNELENLVSLIKNEKEVYEKIAEEKHKMLKKFEEGVKKMAKERQIGFPWLADAYDELFKLEGKLLAIQLQEKKHPALKAAETVKEINNSRRAAEKERKKSDYLVKYYESIAPFLVDLKEEVEDAEEEDRENLKDYTEEELQDHVTGYLTKEEYRKLSTCERNQIALDRYWKRPKSKWHIGKIYERYVGYLFEEKGYEVDYVGIFKGFEDLGRDLICKKKNKMIVIQCKYWSKFRTIYEKHIFQFFGTVFQYKDENPDKDVKAIFYATTELSDLAKRFAKELNIELQDNHKMDKEYPCIKCNISTKDGEKIYHLPFDQMYDKVKIEKDKGEFYCKTVKEAEDAGFRRAFRYRGYIDS